MPSRWGTFDESRWGGYRQDVMHGESIHARGPIHTAVMQPTVPTNPTPWGKLTAIGVGAIGQGLKSAVAKKTAANRAARFGQSAAQIKTPKDEEEAASPSPAAGVATVASAVGGAPRTSGAAYSVSQMPPSRWQTPSPGATNPYGPWGGALPGAHRPFGGTTGTQAPFGNVTPATRSRLSTFRQHPLYALASGTSTVL